MRILHIVPSFYPAVYHGGPINSLYGLCNTLAGKGVELRVLTTDTAGPGRRVSADTFPSETPAGYPAYYCRRRLGVSIAPGVLWHMVRMICWADVVHLTAVYSFPTIPALLACKLLGRPVVWSPRGSFQRWQGSTRVGLKSVWDWACWAVAPQRLVIHATSDEEAAETLKRLPGVEVVTIPNGVELPELAGHHAKNGTLRLLYLGRLDPIKGIENMLAACEALGDACEFSWSLTIAGMGDERYTEAIKAQAEVAALRERVKMVGEVTGPGKEKLFEDADVLVLPSHQESFGMVVAEALAHGLPVIASRRTPWKRVEEVGCGLWVDNGRESLVLAIKKMSRMCLGEMGEVGRRWMEAEFSWDRRADEMIGLYRRLKQQ